MHMLVCMFREWGGWEGMKGELCKIFQVSKYYMNTGYLHEVLGLVGHGFWVNVKLAILHRCSRPVSVGHMTKL